MQRYCRQRMQARGDLDGLPRRAATETPHRKSNSSRTPNSPANERLPRHISALVTQNDFFPRDNTLHVTIPASTIRTSHLKQIGIQVSNQITPSRIDRRDISWATTWHKSLGVRWDPKLNVYFLTRRYLLYFSQHLPNVASLTKYHTTGQKWVFKRSTHATCTIPAATRLSRSTSSPRPACTEPLCLQGHRQAPMKPASFVMVTRASGQAKVCNHLIAG